MIVICTGCGRELTERPCDCPRHRVVRRPLTNLEAVVVTAAAMGGINEDNLRAAADALRGEMN